MLFFIVDSRILKTYARLRSCGSIISIEKLFLSASIWSILNSMPSHTTLGLPPSRSLLILNSNKIVTIIVIIGSLPKNISQTASFLLNSKEISSYNRKMLFYLFSFLLCLSCFYLQKFT